MTAGGDTGEVTARGDTGEVTTGGDVPQAGSRFVPLLLFLRTTFPNKKRFPAASDSQLCSTAAGSV